MSSRALLLVFNLGLVRWGVRGITEERRIQLEKLQSLFLKKIK